MRTISIGALLFGAAILLACSMPSRLLAAAPEAAPDPHRTATPTPFAPAEPTQTSAVPKAEPAQPTPTPTLDPSQPWGSFAAPIQASAIEIPPPAEPIGFDADVVNVLIMGSDYAPHRGSGYRTDVMMILSLNPGQGTASLISLPRDLYVYIPGWRMDRINTADPRGGPDLAAQTILYNFGIPIHHYARMNFSGFTSLINSLGGIEVEVTGYLHDECGGTWYRYSPGSYQMNGHTALCYVRMRKNSSDFDRLRRQQEVMQAIFRKVLSLDGLQRAPQLYEQFRGLVETDMRFDQGVRLLPLASHLANNPSAVQRVTIDASMATSWRVPFSGASVLLPDRPAIEAKLHSSLGS